MDFVRSEDLDRGRAGSSAAAAPRSGKSPRLIRFRSHGEYGFAWAAQARRTDAPSSRGI